MKLNLADEQLIRPAPSLSKVIASMHDPLAVFERICLAENYDHERASESELRVTLPGLWCQHDVSLSWDDQSEHLQLILIFDSKQPRGRSDDMYRLMSLINERLTAGHFDYWHKSGTLVYRHTHTLRGGARLSTDQAQDLISHALDAAERGYPACQYVIWAGKTPEDALTAALIDLAAQV